MGPQNKGFKHGGHREKHHTTTMGQPIPPNDHQEEPGLGKIMLLGYRGTRWGVRGRVRMGNT